MNSTIETKHSRDLLYTIGVWPKEFLDRYAGIFSALEELEPVIFKEAASLMDGSVDALIFGYEANGPKVCQNSVRPILHLPIAREGHSNESGMLEFSEHKLLEPSLRNLRFASAAPIKEELPHDAAFSSLATLNKKVIWAVNSRDLPSAQFWTNCPLPSSSDSQLMLHDYYSRKSCMQLLPIISFLRHITVGNCRPVKSLAACYIVDDPNLHWHTYGYINYANLAKSAKQHRYHVAFAMVPLDTYYSSNRAIEIFREERSSISLLVHGNNHTREELAQARSKEANLRLARQALSRVRRFERMTKLSVSRAMAAPHGACHESVIDAMEKAGFGAAYISRGSMMYHNSQIKWGRLTGMLPGEFLARAFPIIPRDGINDASIPSTILNSLLDKPAIFVCHQEDFKNGLEWIQELSQSLNQRLLLNWANLDQATKQNCKCRTRGDTLLVWVYSTRVKIRTPPQISNVSAVFPRGAGEGSHLMTRGISLHTNKTHISSTKYALEFAVQPGEEFELVLGNCAEAEEKEENFAPIIASALLRRIAVETRDRLRAVLNL